MNCAHQKWKEVRKLVSLYMNCSQEEHDEEVKAAVRIAEQAFADVRSAKASMLVNEEKVQRSEENLARRQMNLHIMQFEFVRCSGASENASAEHAKAIERFVGEEEKRRKECDGDFAEKLQRE